MCCWKFFWNAYFTIWHKVFKHILNSPQFCDKIFSKHDYVLIRKLNPQGQQRKSLLRRSIIVIYRNDNKQNIFWRELHKKLLIVGTFIVLFRAHVQKNCLASQVRRYMSKILLENLIFTFISILFFWILNAKRRTKTNLNQHYFSWKLIQF